jgi:hypothetical protein
MQRPRDLIASVVASWRDVARRNAGRPQCHDRLSIYAGTESDYLSSMASILSLVKQRKAGVAARKVGGYGELIRLEAERRKANGQGQVELEKASGRYVFKPKKPAPSSAR